MHPQSHYQACRERKEAVKPLVSEGGEVILVHTQGLVPYALGLASIWKIPAAKLRSSVNIHFIIMLGSKSIQICHAMLFKYIQMHK